ncbi:hypothetical protein MSAN_02350000 [Mycena sanguinolenta]|uniref:DUF6534 domain-containing protein n=1 Tax=Mycena sanguinolenta TaxID=230812 RepID=A0A8H6X6A8_9AGAR|nr:hypothetical protein MSAN_02350000 [Mycena sanguinolenta]
MPTTRLDAIAGAPLIGTWASSLAYMAELLQARYYFQHFKKDSWQLKSYVAVTLAIDTICAVADYAGVYLMVHHNPRRRSRLSRHTELGRASCFLTFRYWHFTKNTIFVCFLSIPILGALSGGFFSGVIVWLFPAFKDRDKIRISGTVWIVTQVAADIIIAGALVLELMRARSLLKGRRIESVLNRLVLRTLQTGTATAVIAVLSLMAFLIDDKTNVPVGIMYPIGRVYVLSMLINLNFRDSKNSSLSGGQRGAFVFARTTTHDLSAQLRDTNEPHGSNSGTVKNRLAPLQPPSKDLTKPAPRDGNDVNRH